MEPNVSANIDKLEGYISNYVFRRERNKFPLGNFSIVEKEHHSKPTVIARLAKRPSLLMNELRKHKFPLDDAHNLSTRIAHSIGKVLWHDIYQTKHIDDVSYSGAEQYWNVVEQKTQHLNRRNLTPLLLVNSMFNPPWIRSWRENSDSKNDSGAPRPKHLCVWRDSTESTAGYITNFNEIKVFRAPIPQNTSLVLPREIFDVLKVRTFEAGHRIEIHVCHLGFGRTGTITFCWDHEVSESDFPIWRLNAGDNE